MNSKDFKFELLYDDNGINVIFLEDIISNIQENLFIIQAQVAGANKTIAEVKIEETERIVDFVEKQLAGQKFLCCWWHNIFCEP